MPELPEVETVRRVLESWCIDKVVKKVYVYYSPIVNNESESVLNNKLVNQKIVKMERLGKFLVFRFENYSMLSHLRMEGKWHYGHFKDNLNIQDGIAFDPNDLTNKECKHVHFALEFSDGHLLMYHDVRKFGRIQLFDNADCYINEPLTKLGYEPFNEKINASYLLEKFSKFKGTIKEALLDQSIMVGLGNIYCDEVLFSCGILPSELAKNINYEQANNLIMHSIRILNKAIEEGGSTIKSYHAANSVDGKFQNSLLVYGKENEKCVICSSLIFKSKISGRGTHFCPRCQKSNIKNRVIGISGLIGNGKSTVSKLFQSRGYILLDADKITKDAQRKDEFLYTKMIKLFKGYNILNDDLELNRPLIRTIIINNSNLDLELKKLVHKYVYKYIFEQVFKNPNKFFILDVPLLFESHINEICDKIIFVDLDDEIAISRLINRKSMNIEDAISFRNKQKEKLDLSLFDFIIKNNNDLNDLKNNVKEIINELK